MKIVDPTHRVALEKRNDNDHSDISEMQYWIYNSVFIYMLTSPYINAWTRLHLDRIGIRQILNVLNGKLCTAAPNSQDSYLERLICSRAALSIQNLHLYVLHNLYLQA